MYLEYELLLNKDFLHVLRDLVSSARRRVYITSYIASLSRITSDIYYAMAERARNGVDVRVLLNGASKEALKFNEVTAEFLRSVGVKNVKLTQRFTHMKLYIVDDYFIIGSHNLSGSPFMNRFEISLMIHSKEMSDKLSEVFKEMLLNERTEPFIYRGIAFDVYYEILANYKVLSDIFQKTFISNRKVKIMMYIATMSKTTKKYYDLLLEKQDEGAEVAVLLNGASGLSLNYNKPVYDYLKSLGISRVRLTTSFIHAKLLVLDDIAVIGSHNLTSASIAGRLELSIAVKSNVLAGALDAIFEDVWRKDEELAKQNLNTPRPL